MHLTNFSVSIQRRKKTEKKKENKLTFYWSILALILDMNACYVTKTPKQSCIVHVHAWNKQNETIFDVTALNQVWKKTSNWPLNEPANAKKKSMKHPNFVPWMEK